MNREPGADSDARCADVGADDDHRAPCSAKSSARAALVRSPPRLKSQTTRSNVVRARCARASSSVAASASSTSPSAAAIQSNARRSSASSSSTKTWTRAAMGPRSRSATCVAGSPRRPRPPRARQQPLRARAAQRRCRPQGLALRRQRQSRREHQPPLHPRRLGAPARSRPRGLPPRHDPRRLPLATRPLPRARPALLEADSRTARARRGIDAELGPLTIPEPLPAQPTTEQHPSR